LWNGSSDIETHGAVKNVRLPLRRLGRIYYRLFIHPCITDKAASEEDINVPGIKAICQRPPEEDSLVFKTAREQSVIE
jgi:hypothetical protein